jgi:DtxR family Mn-dependent transcriptional regulator
LKITISKENYLKTIAEAESEGENVIAATLVRWLKVSAPAVTMAIRRLKRDELIRVGGEGQISLTRSGRAIASRLLNRHHLIERMLTEVFGMEWYKVHDEAEQLEHAVSADFENKLRERLGEGGICPHGNRVGVDTPDDRRRRGLKRLDEGEMEEHLAVVSVFERDRRFLEHLEKLNVRPGTTICVTGADRDSLTVDVDGKSVHIERPVAERVWVRPMTFSTSRW